ncbi:MULTISPECIES: DUF6273 domain-containing protein [Lactococcus]|uniref:DUF6273 domain-containing protein n=2 Tax=Lactococcus TaxID=1357 RepID=A0AAJ2MLR8_9LACT|nr:MULTISPECIES: DUF6273 domain-containing protein [Lactococcus]MDT2527018.1 DUF6273 domain-containing protein [Lactococcus petauri]MDT2541562.1 DUF6273 domain-containing protein [Lactococcus petauri]MDT2557949.1 DUF6273 domain-containing protein [Lactococcus petauri]MDT2560081.1 DUF6273 domain-containing protein [Lactococcus petauri]MDT2568654.1 DUF6273 domain-containing protein [Lactococcus petauri]
MKHQQNRKFRKIVFLFLLLLLGGTFAWTAFHQQVINDHTNQIRTYIPGRVHDYYNRDTGNKDVFVENYGLDARANAIMVRIRLSEYMEIQRLGEDNPTSLVDSAERGNTSTWTTYLPEENNINRRRGEESSRFNRYSNLVFGRTGTAPWYMPTFNHDFEDLRSAAAGHARDFIQGNGATDAESDGRTHPGDGTENYWTESGERSYFDNGSGSWPGETIRKETKQHLQEERPPMTILQWEQLSPNDRFGYFWVIDPNTGWAYWAELLEPSQATSYLLDAANMTNEVVNSVVNGSYYYAIHVDSQVISPLEMERFLEPEEQGEPIDTRLEAFLEGVKGDGNPRWNRDSEPSDFNFDVMRPGRIFTMAGQQFRYLEDMGSGNHMIILNHPIARNINWNNQETELTRWYTEDFLPNDPGLRAQWEAYIAPVSETFNVGSLPFYDTTRAPNGVITNLNIFDVPYADRTRVVSDGVRRAFALSVADVNHLTRTGSFFRISDRGANIRWWLRTPESDGNSWLVDSTGIWHFTYHSHRYKGVRPALIIHQ